MDKSKTDYRSFILKFLGFCLWGIFVFKNACFNEFNTDEFWAWDIASDLNLIEIIKLMHYEGHTFLWYIVLKPFVFLTDIFPSIFPYIIKYVNLFFLIIAMFLFWFFAPLNNFLKLLISLSLPFITIYPSIGRPYSLTILLIFILTILFKNRLKYPIIYSLILFLCIHTTINGLIAAFVFSIFFLYDLYKENRNNLLSSKMLVPVSIIGLAFSINIIEWIPIHCPSYINEYGTIGYIQQFFMPEFLPRSINGLLTFIIFGPLLQIVLYLNNIKVENKKFMLFMFIIMNMLMGFFIFVAPARFHHLYFVYIFFIIIYWLIIDNYPDYIKNKPAFISYSVLLILMSILYNPMRETDFWFSHVDAFKNDAQEVIETIPPKSTIFLELDYSSGLVPFIKKDYDIKSPQGEPIPSLDAYKNIYQSIAAPIDELPLNKKQDNYYIIPFRYLEDFHMLETFEEYPFCKYTSNHLYLICKIEKSED